MLWIVILGILLILIIAIIITMFKIIKGSNDIQESKERSSNRAKGSGTRKGSGSRNDRGRSNNRDDDHREINYHSRKKPKREEMDYNQRSSKSRKASENMVRGSGGSKRRWKVILIDVATHEEYEFIFSDAIGVGRAFVKEGYEDYLVIHDPKVSKRHCSIFTDGDNLYIQDEGSSNYTFVNNHRVNRPTMIQKEDVIGIGNTELEVFKVFRESR